MSSINGFMVEGQRQYASWGGCVTWLPGDGMSTADAIAAAGLDWEVEIAPAAARIGDRWVESDRERAIVRTDTADIFKLGVTDQYRPVQNREAFDFGDEVLGGPDAPWVAAGTLGSLVYMQARLPREILIGGDPDEKVDPLLGIFNTHDASGAYGMNVQPVRIVCENTCRMARGDMTRGFRLRHTSGLDGRIAQAREALQLTFAYFDEFEKLGNRLIRRKVSDATIDRILADLFPTDAVKLTAEKVDRATTNALRNRDEVKGLLTSKPDLQNVNRTAWGVYQAVCDWSDHHRSAATTGKATAEVNRLYRTLFAEGKREGGFKDRALELLTA